MSVRVCVCMQTHGSIFAVQRPLLCPAAHALEFRLERRGALVVVWVALALALAYTGKLGVVCKDEKGARDTRWERGWSGPGVAASGSPPPAT